MFACSAQSFYSPIRKPALKSPTSVKKILAATTPSNMQRLIHQLDRLRALNSRLAQLLPTPLAQQCKIVALEQNRLTILASSSAWATRLRLQHPKIIKAFHDMNIKSVTSKVAPETPSHTAVTAKKRPSKLSQQTSKLLIELAESTSDPKLKSALRRLSQHSRKQS